MHHRMPTPIKNCTANREPAGFPGSGEVRLVALNDNPVNNRACNTRHGMGHENNEIVWAVDPGFPTGDIAKPGDADSETAGRHN